MTLTITHIKVPDAITNTTDSNEHLYAIGYDPPRYPVPAKIEHTGFISTLWVMGYASNEAFLALCFDDANKYID